MARGRQIAPFEQKVAQLYQEWQSLVETQRELGEDALPEVSVRRGHRRQSVGIHVSAFRSPILLALVEMGGMASRSKVLARIYEMMKDRLEEHDLACVPSGEVRWYGKAQNARQAMIQQGLICPDSSHGIWEITGKGREFLASAKSVQ